jgi:hypothetical protein
MTDPSDATDGIDEGPGWLPVILAGTLLLGILGFVCCGVSTWFLFQKRTEFAVRTLRGSYLPALQQSWLEPQEKKAVVARVEALVEELESGQYENWQSAGVMQRLQRLPVLQWGELAAVEGYVRKSDDPQKDRSLMQLSRLRRAVELDKVTSFDFEDVLKPVLVSDGDSPSGRRLVQPLTAEGVGEVVERATVLADRSQVPEKMFDVQIDQIVRREIETGLSEGGF